MKLTKRKGFNFFRSYYDVYNELDDKDKLQFIGALLDRQFLGVKPDNLTGMAKFAYISQVNSIDSQVKGFEDKTGIILTPNGHPTEPPTHGGNKPPTQQVEGKGEVKGKEKDKNIIFLGSNDEKYFFLVQPPTIGSTKYRVNGTIGLKEFVETSNGMLNLFTDELAGKFMRNNNGNIFDDYRHMWRTWNQFLKQQ